jgi:hypothetical protein
MSFWLWLSGDDTEQFGIIISKYLDVYKYLKIAENTQINPSISIEKRKEMAE